MTEPISNKDFFYQIPETQDDPLWEKIITEMNHYAPPEKVEGMVFFSREVLPVSKPVRKSGEKNSSINLTRFSNPDRDNLNTIGTRGLNVTCYPPKTVITTELVDGEPIDPIEEDLFGGYGRSDKFDELDKKFWVYDRYVPSDQFGVMQKCLDDVFEDGGISDNGKVSSKAPSKQDYVGISLLKMERYGWKELELRAWYDSIEHALNDTQITAYIKDAIRIQNAQGRIDWKDQKYVKQQAKTQGFGKLIPLNTDGAEDGNRQRFERILVPAMKEYLKTHETQKLCLHNTKVSNHQDYDDANEAMVDLIQEDLDLIVNFVDAWRVFKTQPIAVTTRVTEKIGEDDEIGVIVPYTGE
jgi:hypothetical protein